MRLTYTTVKDGLLLSTGLAGIAFQQVSGVINLPLLGVYLMLLGVPGLTSGLWLLNQYGGSQPSGHPSPESASASGGHSSDD
jgi:hypothetical protein